MAIVALVLLRLGVGWHFYKEGSEKVESGKFSSTGFLGSAKGPLAGFYRSLLRDPDGYARLDSKATLAAWDLYRERVARHYGFDEKQQQAAEEVYNRREDQLNHFFRTNGDEIDVYFQSLKDKRDELADPMRQEVASLKGQIGRKAVADVPAEPGPWLAQLEILWAGYEQDLANLASDEQYARGPLPLPRPGVTTLGVEQVDKILPYFDLLVGACLILGLFTRVAAVAAALFLCSVIATQWPGAPDAAPVYYQTVEMLALVVLAAFGAGRYAGLDSLINYALGKCCAGKQESRRESKA